MEKTYKECGFVPQNDVYISVPHAQGEDSVTNSMLKWSLLADAHHWVAEEDLSKWHRDHLYL